MNKIIRFAKWYGGHGQSDRGCREKEEGVTGLTRQERLLSGDGI